MNYEIIFYRSGQTAAMQQRLEQFLQPYGLSLSGASAAGEADELGKHLSSALKKSRLIITIGGLDDSAQSTEKLLARMLTPKSKDTPLCCLLSQPGEGCYIKSGGQVILILPDRPDALEALNDRLAVLFKEAFQLEAEKTVRPDTDKIGEQISSDLSISKRSPVMPYGSTAEKRNSAILKTLKIALFILLAAGILEAAGALLYYFLTR